ncbi:Acyl-CoA dehydrogenase [Candidatus Ichthyocystis hellenicum]|uniref:Acyl-coenzyme A dehydrogenase n=1 Tax=Candidatus Ichthyocystis hellenicum TaxID=1561003 RepID=A0A0S4M7P1_9BURK|nr:acyl-CoA dehydrogenase [Candidatus Ichthyocystis hellenicum]CUT17412.1 Acyl-CoA dehydrogenase [Candidatus Ichthyocystis hellenicum]
MALELLTVFFLLGFFLLSALFPGSSLAFLVFGSAVSYLAYLLNFTGTQLSFFVGSYFSIWFLLSFSPLRRSFITNRIFNIFKRVMPPISATEKDAIEAGTIWWDAQIFSGKPSLKLLSSFKEPTLTQEEKNFLDEDVEELCSLFTEWDTFKHRDLPAHVWSFIRERGFLGIAIPKEFGGKGFSPYAHGVILQKISSHCCAAVIHVMVPNSLGPAELLINYGTEEQRNKYLSRLAQGIEVPAFALTSPEAGSDASSIPDYGIVCRGEWEGEEIIGMRLTWNKRYITMGPICTLLGLAFKLYDPDHLIGDKEDIGITCAIIPSDLPGIEIGRRHYPVDAVFQNGPNSAKDLFIPLSFVIGGVDMVGQGWKMLMESLSEGRGVSLPNTALGSSKLGLFSTTAYAFVRRQFSSPICFFEGVQLPIARMTAFVYIMESMWRLNAIALNLGEKPSVISAICKYHITEMQRKVLSDAMDIQAGKAICSGPNNYIARAYSQTPVAMTVEGANILTRCLIIFGQGAIRCHPFVLREMLAVASTDKKAIKEFDKALFGHIAFIIRNTIVSFWHGITSSRLVCICGMNSPKKWRPYIRHFLRFSAAFAMVSDFSMLIVGGKLKRKEGLSARLGDILSYLFMISAVIKRYDFSNFRDEDEAVVAWSLNYLFVEMQRAFYEFFDNFPLKIFSKILKRLVFPWGPIFKSPTDELSIKLSNIVTSPSVIRDSYLENMFLSKDPLNPLARLNKAFRMADRANEISKKIRKIALDPWIDARQGARHALGKGLIKDEEYEFYLGYLDLYDDVIKVDDFSKDLEI